MSHTSDLDPKPECRGLPEPDLYEVLGYGPKHARKPLNKLNLRAQLMCECMLIGTQHKSLTDRVSVEPNKLMSQQQESDAAGLPGGAEQTRFEAGGKASEIDLYMRRQTNTGIENVEVIMAMDGTTSDSPSSQVALNVMRGDADHQRSQAMWNCAWNRSPMIMPEPFT